MPESVWKMRALRLLLILLCGSGLAPSALQAADAQEQDSYHLVLLAPSHPIFIRLDAQTDGAGLKGMRERYAAKLVARYDVDKNGTLSKTEAVKVPPLLKRVGMAESYSLVDTWVSVDAAPPDDEVSVAELTDYIHRIFGSPLVVSVRSQRSTQLVDMFALLDLNRDGKLGRDEIRVARTTLRKLDADDDETLTVEELQGMRTGLVPGVFTPPPERQSADVPILQLYGETEITASAQRLVDRYRDDADANTQSKDNSKAAARSGDTDQPAQLSNERPLESTPPTSLAGISQRRLGVSDDDFRIIDRDMNGFADSSELASWLKSPTPNLVLQLALFKAKRGKAQWSIVNDELKIARKTTTGNSEKLVLTANGVSLELGITRTIGNAADARNFFRSRFRQVDGDKNKYLNEAEFMQLQGDFQTNGIYGASFASVDTDSDGMVTDPELSAFVEQESSAQQSRVELVVSHDGESVFEILGGKADRRLSPREFIEGVTKLAEHDLDGDGAISPTEMVGKYRMAAELGTPAMFKLGGRGQRVTTPDGMMSGTAPMPTRGPMWFRKMDRNRDGDVSRREFLGPRARFDALDKDGDDLLSADEAEAAEPADRSAAETSSPRDKTEANVRNDDGPK